eukprot:27273-Pleurochrysis_carterae.AAC.2
MLFRQAKRSTLACERARCVCVRVCGRAHVWLRRGAGVRACATARASGKGVANLRERVHVLCVRTRVQASLGKCIELSTCMFP